MTFSLNNAGDGSGTNGLSMSSARVTGYRSGLLELKGNGGISLSGAATFDSNASFSGKQINNLGAATADTDAVNFSQLKGVANTAANALGGGSTANSSTGLISAPSYKLDSNKATVTNVGDALSNLDTRTTANTTSVNALTAGTAGLVKQADNTSTITVGGTSGGRTVNFMGTDTDGVSRITRTLTGVSAGTISDVSSDAINGTQLYNVNKSVASALGGGATVNTDGTLKAPTYTVGGTQVNSVDKALGSLDTATTANKTAIDTTNTNLGNLTSTVSGIDSRVTDNATEIGKTSTRLDTLTVNAVQYDSADKTSVTLNNGGAAVQVKNVANGTADTDAANVGQVKAVQTASNATANKLAEALGGGAAVDGNGNVTAPTYTFKDGSSAQTVGNALSNLDGRVDTNTKNISELSTQINSGAVGLVQQDATTQAITVASATGGTSISVAGTDGVRTLSGVKDGSVVAGSTEAVTGNQLFKTESTITDMSGKVDGIDTRVTDNTSEIGKANTRLDTLSANALQYDDASKASVTLNNGGAAVQLKNVADGTQDSDAVNLGQLKATTQQVSDLGALAVKYDDASKTAVTFGQAGTPVQLKNVATGTADTDAANVGQVNTAVGKVSDDLNTLDKAAVKYDASGNVTLNASGSAVQVKNVADGTEDTDAVNLHQLKQSGMVNADGSVASVVTYADADKKTVKLAGADGTVLTNLKDGSIAANSMDAINGGQLHTAYQNLASTLGGGAGLNDGVWTAPKYTIGGQDYRNVGDALKNLDGRVVTLEGGQNQASGMFAGNGDTTAGGSKQDALASGNGATAMGANAVASADNSVAIGAGSVADQANSVSVGSVGQERAITNVMAGTNATDAVNVQQLNDVKTQAAKTQQSVDTLQSQVNQRFDQVDNRMNRLGAMNAAMSTMVASAAGLQTDNRMAIGTGLYRGQTALAIGYQRKVNPRLTVTVGGSTAGGSEYNVGAGVGYGW